MLTLLWAAFSSLYLSSVVRAHAHHEYAQQQPFGGLTFDTNAPVDISEEPWASKYGAQNDLGFSGPLSFSHFAYRKCLEDASVPFDVGIIGFPFDTTTSYRPGESPCSVR